eukprot:TRINITY_DN51072_c0_g1_i1.p1 TRINITY_DN51072_c0_g1~~TRINITY_DN51072_c0_g1_i1.p1  ORF type:complete len:308 (+),score=54.67 TRINITY_DN51072_c0_g1_i1:90-1013(+)
MAAAVPLLLRAGALAANESAVLRGGRARVRTAKGSGSGLTIFLLDDCGSQTAVDCGPDWTVGELREAAHQALGLGLGAGITLNFGGTALTDASVPLADAGVGQEAVVVVSTQCPIELVFRETSGSLVFQDQEQGIVESHGRGSNGGLLCHLMSKEPLRGVLAWDVVWHNDGSRNAMCGIAHWDFDTITAETVWAMWYDKHAWVNWDGGKIMNGEQHTVRSGSWQTGSCVTVRLDTVKGTVSFFHSHMQDEVPDSPEAETWVRKSFQGVLRHVSGDVHMLVALAKGVVQIVQNSRRVAAVLEYGGSLC